MVHGKLVRTNWLHLHVITRKLYLTRVTDPKGTHVYSTGCTLLGIHVYCTACMLGHSHGDLLLYFHLSVLSR